MATDRFEGPRGMYAFRVELPPVADRPNPDTVAALDRWNMYLPGQHAFWSRYSLFGCSLADFPGVPPAKKQYPAATHEIIVAAIDPDFPQASFEAGGVGILEPMNYVRQVTTTDEKCNALLRHLAEKFAAGHLLVEPQGIHGARELFDGCVDTFLSKE